MKIGAAGRILGTTPGQLRKWESTGELMPARKTRGGTGYYLMSDLLEHQASPAEPLTVCYARVSSQEQKDDLDRQHAALEAYCGMKGWRTQVIRDMGSGMNYRKKGLQELLEMILSRGTERLVENPKPLAVASKRLRQVDKVLARSRDVHGRINHSNRRSRLYVRRRRLHTRVVNIRNDQRHKATTMIAKSAGRVVVETLNVAGMMMNRRMARPSPTPECPASWPSWSTSAPGTEPST